MLLGLGVMGRKLLLGLGEPNLCSKVSRGLLYRSLALCAASPSGIERIE